MTDTPDTGERIAKVMARAGVASRRNAERLILEGRVAVNGQTVTSPALDVLPTDKVTLNGKPIDAPQPARLWLHYKPLGLVTSEKDEKGRQTVFESLPDGMPRVMSVGRLDLNSEGLLLLTNDGGLKRRLELPSTGWLRKYRVRVNGRPNEATFDPLRRGITIDGEDFLPMDIHLDRQQGANAWLTVGLREGKNREIRRAMTEVGLTVNRLIRVSYGPFRLNEMQPGDVIEVKQKVLKEQLGDSDRKPDGDRPARRPARPDAKPGVRDGARSGPRSGADRDGERRYSKPHTPREGTSGGDAERPPRKPRAGKAAFAGERPARSGPRAEGAERPYVRKERGSDDRPPRGPRKPYGDGDSRPPRRDGSPSRGPDRAGKSDRPERKEGTGWKDKPDRGDRPQWKAKAADADRGERKPHGNGDSRPPRRDGGPSRGPDRAGKSDRPDRKEGTGWKGKSDRGDRPARPDKRGDDRPNRGERPQWKAKAADAGSGERKPRHAGPKPTGSSEGGRHTAAGPKGPRRDGPGGGGGKPRFDRGAGAPSGRPASGQGGRPKGPPRGPKGSSGKK